MQALELLKDAGLEPSVLIVASGKNADFAGEMKEKLPGVPLLEGAEFRSPAGVNFLSSMNVDYFISVHFPYIIPAEVLRIPRVGALNLHPAFLPYNRGWHTPSWAIIDGTPYGATLHWVDEGIDTGELAMQKQIEVLASDTANSLYQRALAAEVELFKEAIPHLLNDSLPRVAQTGSGTSHVKGDLKELQRLNLSEKTETESLVRRLRALTTNDVAEAAFFEINGKRYRIRIDISEE